MNKIYRFSHYTYSGIVLRYNFEYCCFTFVDALLVTALVTDQLFLDPIKIFQNYFLSTGKYVLPT